MSPCWKYARASRYWSTPIACDRAKRSRTEAEHRRSRKLSRARGLEVRILECAPESSFSIASRTPRSASRRRHSENGHRPSPRLEHGRGVERPGTSFAFVDSARSASRRGLTPARRATRATTVRSSSSPASERLARVTNRGLGSTPQGLRDVRAVEFEPSGRHHRLPYAARLGAIPPRSEHRCVLTTS